MPSCVSELTHNRDRGQEHNALHSFFFCWSKATYHRVKHAIELLQSLGATQSLISKDLMRSPFTPEPLFLIAYA